MCGIPENDPFDHGERADGAYQGDLICEGWFHFV